jgi:hypothetical protein
MGHGLIITFRVYIFMVTNKLCTCKPTLHASIQNYCCLLHFIIILLIVSVSSTLPHLIQWNTTNSMTGTTPRAGTQCRTPSPSTDSPTLHTTDCKPLEYYQYPLAALGALQGLSLVILALVTTGWVCTCRSMKKREARKSSTCIR